MFLMGLIVSFIPFVPFGGGNLPGDFIRDMKL